MSPNKEEKLIKELVSLPGITINGENPWDIQVHNKQFYQRILSKGSLGLGESYMDKWWDCDALDEFFDRVLRASLDKKLQASLILFFYALKAKLFNLQSKARAFEVGEKHYDLGNDLFRAMLDKRMNYTCGYWKNAKNLDEAQEAKLELVCKKINLKPGMTVLELGCGYGGFAKYAAEKYGVKVLGVTVSKAQVEYGMELCKGLPVELRLQDYREVTGKFDRVISIGILEHVGHKNYRTYMEIVNKCLKDDGIAFVHTIGGNIAFKGDPWMKKYIFPNGMIPTIYQIGKAVGKLFIMEDWHNFGPDYDKTLMTWHSNFEHAWPQLKSNYDERFYRMWRYYLLICAGFFRARVLQLWQIVMTKPGTKQPNCRIC